MSYYWMHSCVSKALHISRVTLCFNIDVFLCFQESPQIWSNILQISSSMKVGSLSQRFHAPDRSAPGIKVQTPVKHAFFGHKIHNYYLMDNNIFIKLCHLQGEGPGGLQLRWAGWQTVNWPYLSHFLADLAVLGLLFEPVCLRTYTLDNPTGGGGEGEGRGQGRWEGEVGGREWQEDEVEKGDTRRDREAERVERGQGERVRQAQGGWGEGEEVLWDNSSCCSTWAEGSCDARLACHQCSFLSGSSAW